MKHGRALAFVVVSVLIGALWAGFRDMTSHARPEAAGSTEAERARNFWALYLRAGNARSTGSLDEAVALYREALDLRPEHEDSLYYLGNCLLERRDYTGAVRAFERLVALNPEGSSRGYMQLASIRASLDPDAPVDLAEAVTLFERALELDPDSGALLGLAEVAVLQHRLLDAERLLQRVDADNAMSIAAPYLRGYLAFESGDHDRAWELFRTAVSRGAPKNAPIKWTQEGDVKSSPEVRWRALVRQSVFGAHWIRVRAYVAAGPSRADMQREYARLHGELVERWR